MYFTYETHVWSCVQCWGPQYKDDMDMLDWVQWNSEKITEVSEHLPDKERTGLVQLWEENIRQDLTG